MFKFIKKLFGCKSANTPVIDKMISIFRHLTINNDVTYSGDLYGRTVNGDDLPEEVKREKYFKIKIGKLMSGHGDWGRGFDYVHKPFVEIHVNCYSEILYVCAGEPFYNSAEVTKEAATIAKKLVDELNAQLAQSENKRIVTNNMWLRGALDTIRSICWTSEVDLWKRRIEIYERKQQ